MASEDVLMTRVMSELHRLLHSDGANELMQSVHSVMSKCGIPPPYPDAERLAISFLTFLATLILYFFLFGKRHRRRRKKLQKELTEYQQKVQELQDKLAELEEEDDENDKKNVRIWMDGAFDMMHYGHMNAFRQGKAMGTYLIVGVNDDQSITTCKGAPPVMNDQERIVSVMGCKFVDAVEEHCPYVMNEEYLRHIIDKHQIDYVVHGDDPCIVDGKDVYETARALKKYRTIPRTEGVSTSDILGRMLLMNKSHHTQTDDSQKGKLSSKVDHKKALKARPSKFLTTNRMLRLFSVGNKDPAPNARIVYVDGAFDMFHSGHVNFLQKAKEEGDYLIVGVHNDAIVNEHRGMNYPIMNLHERVLSVLGCKFVDDVLIDAPWAVTREMVASLNISAVIHGSKQDSYADGGEFNIDNHYSAPKQLGIFKTIKSPSNLDVKDIVERINQNRERFEKKFEKKMKSEEEYYAERYAHVAES